MYPNIPTPDYSPSAKRLEEEYKKAYKEILEQLVGMSNISPDEDVYQRQASLLRQIEVLLAGLNDFNRQWCEEEVKKAFAEGQAYAILSSGGATTLAEAMAGVQFSMLAQNTVEAMVSDTMNDLLQATNNTDRRIKQMVRQTVGNVIRQRTIQGYGRNTIRNDITKQLTKKFLEEKAKNDAFVGIVDRAGRRWKVNRYADMISRTKLNQAHVEGVRTEGINRGIDTAVISTHNAEDECNKFEGMIISLNGLTEGLLTYQELYDTNLIFHPNCQHKVHLVKLELLPKAVIEKHEAKVRALKNPTLKGKIKPLSEIKVPEKETVQNFSTQLTLL